MSRLVAPDLGSAERSAVRYVRSGPDGMTSFSVRASNWAAPVQVVLLYDFQVLDVR